MIIVSDTGPINYLQLIDHLHILPQVFGRIMIPYALHDELMRMGTPKVV